MNSSRTVNTANNTQAPPKRKMIDSGLKSQFSLFKKIALSKSKKTILVSKQAKIDKPKADKEGLAKKSLFISERENSPLLSNGLPNMAIEKLLEQSPGILSSAKISQQDHEINQLIKKLTLSFTAKKEEAQFIIGEGILKGAQFNVITDEQNLSITVNNASPLAKELLSVNQSHLADRLIEHEINLLELRFTT